MSTIATAPANVRVHCRAQHPDPKRRGELCATVLGDIPATYHYVGTAARRPHAPDDRIRLQCHRRDCRTWNIFAHAAPDPVA